MNRQPRLAAAVLMLALSLAGCSGDTSPQADGADQTQTTAEDVGTKPEFEVDSDEDPPDTLQVDDLVAGDGEQAAPGDTVTVHYVGKAWSTGQEFDASWDRGQPFTFELGAGDVIAGWDEGVDGMAVGGRRRLVIPPAKGYGDRGAGDAIGPGETLVFVVDLLAVG